MVWDQKKRTALIIDVCVPNDLGINRAETEKVTKYQDLKHAVKESWNLSSSEVIPVVVGATGLMKEYLNIIPGKPQRHGVQEAAVRGTISILKRALGALFL